MFYSIKLYGFDSNVFVILEKSHFKVGAEKSCLKKIQTHSGVSSIGFLRLSLD